MEKWMKRQTDGWVTDELWINEQMNRWLDGWMEDKASQDALLLSKRTESSH